MPTSMSNTHQFSSEQANRIFLTGFMGAGKSTIGKMLAKALKQSFYDTDQLAIRGFGNKSISEIFETIGEPAFREAENKIIQELCKRSNFVASTGGGTLVRSETLTPALSHGIVIYLYAPVDLLFERVVFSGKDRPILSEPDTEQCFQQRFQDRETFYQQAHITVATHTQSRDAVVQEILQALKPLTGSVS